MARPREILSLDDLKSRLLARIAIREDGCWMWLGAWSDSGYGAMHYEGKQLLDLLIEERIGDIYLRRDIYDDKYRCI